MILRAQSVQAYWRRVHREHFSFCVTTCIRPVLYSESQGSHSQILMTGRSDRGSYFIPIKVATLEFVYPKNALHFLRYPPKSLILFSQPKKIPLVFFSRPQKNPSVFHGPKITFGQNFSRPQKITRTSFIIITIS